MSLEKVKETLEEEVKYLAQLREALRIISESGFVQPINIKMNGFTLQKFTKELEESLGKIDGKIGTIFGMKVLVDNSLKDDKVILELPRAEIPSL